MYFALVMSDKIDEIRGFNSEEELDEFAIERSSFSLEEKKHRKAERNTYGPSVIFALKAESLDKVQENNFERPVAIYLRGDRYDCVKRKPLKKDSPQLTDAQKLQWFKNDFRPHFDEWVEAPAKRMIAADDSVGVAMPAFIWLICAIDWLAGYLYGGPTDNVNRASYIRFINEYFPKQKYDAQSMYEKLRCGLVHMYTIKDNRYALTHRRPEFHLYLGDGGLEVINLEDFYADWSFAKNSYFDAVERNSVLLEKAYNRHQSGFLGLIPIKQA